MDFVPHVFVNLQRIQEELLWSFRLQLLSFYQRFDSWQSAYLGFGYLVMAKLPGSGTTPEHMSLPASLMFMAIDPWSICLKAQPHLEPRREVLRLH